jgi:hypothetical protein
MPVITKPNQHFDTTLWTGTGASTQSVTNSGSMQPDLVWVKDRSQSTLHVLTDVVRGSGKSLYSSSTNAEGTNDSTGYLSAFNSNGFTLNRGSGGLGERVNYNGDNYVGWQWKAGGAAVTNTAGSITSQVSANPTAGFSVVTYTGTGSAATIGHGLGVAPNMVIVKCRSNAISAPAWPVWHTAIPASNYLDLQTTIASSTASSVWNSTLPTSSVFSVGTTSSCNSSGFTYVAYCWAPIAGYSAFGSYTGNNSNDGPFVFTNFKPKFVLIKSSTSAENWWLMDSARDSYNVASAYLNPNTSNAEASFATMDFLSNGFKLRYNGAAVNQVQTYIYMAFAEAPFKYSLAR